MDGKWVGVHGTYTTRWWLVDGWWMAGGWWMVDAPGVFEKLYFDVDVMLGMDRKGCSSSVIY